MCQRQSEIPLMTKEEPFKSALFMGAGRENMAAGRTGSSHRKNAAQRIRSARSNQTEQAVCPQTRCGVTVLRVSNAALDVPTQKESLVRSLICKVVFISKSNKSNGLTPHPFTAAHGPHKLSTQPLFLCTCSLPHAPRLCQHVPILPHLQWSQFCSLILQRSFGSFSLFPSSCLPPYLPPTMFFRPTM